MMNGCMMTQNPQEIVVKKFRSLEPTLLSEEHLDLLRVPLKKVSLPKFPESLSMKANVA